MAAIASAVAVVAAPRPAARLRVAAPAGARTARISIRAAAAAAGGPVDSSDAPVAAHAGRRALLTAAAVALAAPSLLSALSAEAATVADLPAAATLYGDAKAVAAVRKAALAALKPVVSKENAGNLLRAAFHDAGTFDAAKKTGGANGSLRFELSQPENGGLKYGLAILEGAKKNCPQITWADFIQLAGAAAVAKTGGPTITVPMGRPDAAGPDPRGQLPAATLDAAGLKELFLRNGYSAEELVALSGAHTIGVSRANKNLAGSKGPMEPTPQAFDNLYFKLLLGGDFGAFPSDRTLTSDPETRAVVDKFAKSQGAFFKSFASAYVKMGLQGVAAA